MAYILETLRLRAGCCAQRDVQLIENRATHTRHLFGLGCVYIRKNQQLGLSPLIPHSLDHPKPAATHPRMTAGGGSVDVRRCGEAANRRVGITPQCAMRRRPKLTIYFFPKQKSSKYWPVLSLLLLAIPASIAADLAISGLTVGTFYCLVVLR